MDLNGHRNNRTIAEEPAPAAALPEDSGFFDFVEAVPQMVWSTLSDGTHDYLNARFVEFTGVSNVLFRKNDAWKQLVHPDDRDRVAAQWAHCLRTGDAYEIEYRMRHRSGAYYWSLVRAQPVRDAHGSVQRWVGTCTDIHAVKQNAEQLRRSEALLSAIFENSPAAIFLKAAGGELILANKTVKTLLGQVVGKRHEEFQDIPNHCEAVERHDDLVRSTRMPVETEECITTTTGEKKVFRIVKFPVDYEASGKTAVGGIAVDITELKQTEQELSRSNIELARFACVVSHDLKEPLRTLSHYVSLLTKKYAQDFNGSGRGYLDGIAQCTGRMNTLIDSLLRYSQSETPPETTRVPAKEAVDAALANLSRSLDECGAIVTVDAPAVVLADRNRLIQIFQNLLGNAIKYRHPQRRPEVAVSACEASNEWVFSVKDNGIGMEAHHLREIFVLFRRLNTSADALGTGVGLAVCKRVVEAQGGQIWAESTRGQGSCFYFTLPKSVTA